MEKSPYCDETGSADERAAAHTATIARLFREHNDALLKFLAARLRSQQEAKEIAQEAYVKLLNLDRPHGISFQRAFLFKTAANLAIDRLRHRQRRHRIEESGVFDELGEEPTPEQHTAAAQQVERLEKLVAELPAKCRQAFLLYKIEGLEFPEVAKRMALSERMVRDYVVRALMYCRVGLDEIRDGYKGGCA